MEAAAPVAPAVPAPRRGDFAGVLPPPHSVWDVDEAWFDLDEFSKVGQGVGSHMGAGDTALTAFTAVPHHKLNVPTSFATTGPT